MTLLALLLLLPARIHAAPDSAAAPAQAELQEIVITASRLDLPISKTPFAVSVLDTKDLQGMSKTIGADEALRSVPGLRVENATDGERVHMYIRGCGVLTETGVRGTRVLLDGIPLNDPSGFVPDLYDINWSTVRRIEVLRGAAASLYGASASCGVVNLETQRGGPSAAAVGGSEYVGTHGFHKAVGQFGGAAGPADYRVELSQTRGDGYRVHQNFFGSNLYTKGDIKLGDNVRLTPVFAWTRYFNQNPEGLNLTQLGQDPSQPNADAVPKNEYWRTERVTGGLSGQIGLTPSQHVAFSAYARGTDFTESVPGSVAHSKMSSPGGSVQYTHVYEGNEFKNHASAGSDFEWQTVGSYKRANLGGAIEDSNDIARQSIHQEQAGFFAADSIELGEKVALMANIRYDMVGNRLYDDFDSYSSTADLSGQKNFHKTTGRFGVTYSLMPEANIYANWGMGFLPPSTDQLVNNPANERGFNQSLSPSGSQNEEIGVRGVLAHQRFSYDAAFYHLSTKNDFSRYRSNNITYWTNTGLTDKYGVELHAKANPVTPVTIQASYTYSDFRYENKNPIQIVMDNPADVRSIFKGSRIPNVPVHQGGLDVRYDMPRGFSLDFGADAFSRVYIDGANILPESVPGYPLLRAKLACRLSNGELSLGVQNLLDRKWVAFTEPDAGGNSYQPGPGREIFFNVAIKWDVARLEQ